MSGAAKTMDEDSPKPAAAAAAPKGKPVVLIMIVAVVLSAAASGGAAWWFSSHGAAAQHGEAAKEEEKPKLPAQYLALDPAFVVNLADESASRYLQVEVQVMGRETAELEAVKLHQPRIRNALLLLFGQQKPADLESRAGKEKLQVAVLAEIQKILKDETGKPGVEAVYFTSFVMQ